MKPPRRLWLGTHFPVFLVTELLFLLQRKEQEWVYLENRIVALLLAISTGVQCQDQINQKPVEVFKEGDDPTITCQFSSNNVYSIHWYRQYPGKVPVFLLTVTSVELEKKGHFSASFDNKKKESQFNITKVQMKDDAVYFCGAQDHSNTEAPAACTKTL
ncbi:hypothetical protein NXF25_021360 [Crotalus adamanteus]|uniref:Ig-like domain-containing protein n=1 Tax=Crotalus adamanteus TaxID=8729 RepID=A0AAW1B7K1_CROAD